MRLLSLLMVLATGPLFAADAPKMNVLFIVSDDLCNVMGCYGDPRVKTPNIDKLAQRGVRFDKAYCQYPLCNPSRSSFLTGLRPDTLKIYENATQIRQTVPNAQTLPQTFRKAGYTAVRVGKLYHYGVPAQIGTDGLDDPASWDHVVNPKGRDKDDEDKIFSLNPKGKGPGRFGGTLSWLAAEGTDAEQTDGKIAAEVVKLLAANKEKPFFLACGFFRPHTPYVAPKKYFDLYPTAGDVLPVVPAGQRAAGPAPAFASSKPEQDRMTDEQRKLARQAYFASVSFMDAQLGKVVDELEKQKLIDNTIVVFLSDHGYHLGEHGLWQKRSLFENSCRVPLVIADPRGKAQGKACGKPVELVDLHATLADLCGLPVPKTDGASLKPLLTDPAAKWDKPALTQVLHGGGKNAQIMGRSVRTETHRYTEWGDAGANGVQLFEYATDPKEEKNLAADPKYAGVVKELRKALRK